VWLFLKAQLVPAIVKLIVLVHVQSNRSETRKAVDKIQEISNSMGQHMLSMCEAQSSIPSIKKRKNNGTKEILLYFIKNEDTAGLTFFSKVFGGLIEVWKDRLVQIHAIM
jgi:phage-related protein